VSTQQVDGFVMPSVAEQLKKICVESKVTDPNMVLDVYLVVANQGKASFLPEEELMQDIERTDPRYWDIKLEVSKKQQFLEKLAQSKYMQALVKLQDPMKAVLTFIDHMKKARQAQKASTSRKAPIDHQGNGTINRYATESELDGVAAQNESYDAALDFDAIIGGATTQIDVAEDDGLSAFIAGTEEEAEDGEAIESATMDSACGGKKGYTSYTVSPGQILSSACVKYGLDLPTMFPVLFQCYNKLLEDMKIGKLKEVDVDKDTKHKRDDQMEDFDKLSTVDAVEVANDTFDKRIAEKSLVVKHDRDEECGMSHVFILLDVSGSMMGADLGGRVCRAFAANVVTLALLNFAFKDKYKVWVLPFEGTVGSIQEAENKQQALDVMKWLGTVDYNGGGTDIEGAVLRAYKLTECDPTYNKADIVLITDGCSPISNRLKTEKPSNTKLRAILISDAGYGNHSDRLCAACDAWHNLTWDNKTNTFCVGNTLRGISSTESTVEA
jgi:Mg-chelatase subunit ChlD